MIRTGIIEVTRQVEQQVVDAFGLTPVEISPELARRHGEFRGGRIVIESSMYRGNRIRNARFAVVYGETLEIGNILCVPDPDFVVPILGADLVAVRESSVMVAADLSPVSSVESDHVDQFQRLARFRESSPELPSGGELPEWAKLLFSPHALYTRVGLDQATDAFEALNVFPARFIEELQMADAQLDRRVEISRSQGHYSNVHRADDKGLRLLGAMFGMEWAQRYLEEFLFPPEDIL